jgi:hypothetical protein
MIDTPQSGAPISLPMNTFNTYGTGPEVHSLKLINGVVIDTSMVLVVVDHPKDGVSVYLSGLDKPVYIEGLTVEQFLEEIG